MKLLQNLCVFLLFLSFSTALLGELLIVKKQDNVLAPLSSENQDDLQAGEYISQLIFKYEWPMVIASSLTDKEQSELLKPGVPFATEQFINRKIQEQPTLKQYQVIFISTALYELFALVDYIKTIDDQENPLQRTLKNIGFGYDYRKLDDQNKALYY